jgi:hypothetical protein
MDEKRSMRRREGARDEIADWMSARWAEIEGRGPDATVGAVGERADARVEPDFSTPEPMDLGLRFAEAKAGDSISKLVGSSDPRAIGKFMGLNGMRGQGSTLRPGRSYVVPSRWDDATRDELALGTGALHVDNARLREIDEERVAQARQVALLADGRNIWTGARTEATIPSSRSAHAADRSWLDESATAKAVGGTLAFGAGLAPGAVRGAVHSAEGIADAGVLTYRMMSPFDVMLSRPGHSTRDRVALGMISGTGAAAQYASGALADPSIVRDDIASAAERFNKHHNPFATPVSETFGGELKRTSAIGMNDGERVFDTASLVGGAGFMRGALKLVPAAPAAGAKEIAYRAARPRFDAYLDEFYKGMGHHIKRRATRFPKWLGGGPLPAWFMEGPLNKIAQDGLTRRDFLRNHVGADLHFNGARAAKRSGQKGWSARDLGWDKYGVLDRLEYGTAPATKSIFVLGGAGTAFDGLPEGEGVQ